MRKIRKPPTLEWAPKARKITNEKKKSSMDIFGGPFLCMVFFLVVFGTQPGVGGGGVVSFSPKLFVFAGFKVF